MYRELRTSRGLGARGALSAANQDLLWLPRAAVVASVSALDSYMHSMLYERIPVILNSPNVPDALCEALSSHISIKNAGGFRNALPLLKNHDTLGEIFAILKSETLSFLSYQAPDKIIAGFALIGEDQIFDRVSAMWPGPGTTADRIRRDLVNYVKRRNQIAHEADAEANGISRPMQPEYALGCKDFVVNLTLRLNRIAYGI
nr:HEPN domain-containing protein [Dokdonella sp.]